MRLGETIARVLGRKKHDDGQESWVTLLLPAK